MSSKAGQRSSSIDRVRQQVEFRALREARKVPWRILAGAADEYTEWEVFALWLRAALDACGRVPAELAPEIEKRVPSVLSAIVSEPWNGPEPLGSRVWEYITQWTESNVFADAKRERWLNAIRFFSSKSLLSMKAWSYWEDIHRQWSDAKPPRLESYERWASEVSAVSRLSNPASDAQRVIDSIQSIPEASWQQLLDAFMELTTLCLWIEVLSGAGRSGEELISQEVALRYPLFEFSRAERSKATISALTEWVLEQEVPFASTEPPLFALGHQIKCHPAYYARRNYAAWCRGLWKDGHLDRLPTFSEWMTAADGYFER